MQELRTDLLTGEQVILATGRAMRPDTFRVQSSPLPAAVAGCPFCAGNEHETPPEVMRIGPGAPETPGWHVRVVPNKYPLVGDGVAGAHEVVILSPAHDAGIGDLPPIEVQAAFGALRDRAAFQLANGCVFAQPFVNHGKAAGASIEHPHAQLVALDFVPARVAARLERFAADGDLVLADIEASPVVRDGDAVVWCPYGSATPFVTRVAARGAGPRFDPTSDAELAAVAAATHQTVAQLQTLLGDVAYNLVVETAPRDSGPFHWWIDVIPRLTVAAGFELGTGTWANIVAPEAAAAALRGDG
jgi:UDPglucose--hexose-1-phosphate uridylyltransferase